MGEMLAQRVFALACGYPDANDAARLAEDPVHKLLVDRDPVTGEALASQPTLSRFENVFRPRDLVRLGETFAETVIAHHRKRLRGKARRITIDLDVTDDPTHGVQQLAFFNGFYDSWCYLPLLGFVTFGEEPEQYLVAAVLRPGNARPQLAVLGVLRRLLDRLRRAFPKARVLVRLDAGFASPELFDFLETYSRLDYVVGCPKNSVLARLARPYLRMVRQRSQRTRDSEREYGSDLYAARTWPRKRRVLFKAEVLRPGDKPPKDNLRFLVTNLHASPQHIFQHVYAPRGDVENRIKELDHSLALGRTSCSSFWANQLRVLLTATAYALLQEVRRRAAPTRFARAQVATLRERLLKIGTHVVRSVRRVVLHLPAPFPDRDAWTRIACALGARTG
jgi:hypothetical protein